jgi:hypothetical protein
MPATEQPVRTRTDGNRGQMFDWKVAAILGTYTDLLREILRKFELDTRGPMVQWVITAVFWVTLFTAMLIVPIYLLTKASEKTGGQKDGKGYFHYLAARHGVFDAAARMVWQARFRSPSAPLTC